MKRIAHPRLNLIYLLFPSLLLFSGLSHYFFPALPLFLNYSLYVFPGLALGIFFYPPTVNNLAYQAVSWTAVSRIFLWQLGLGLNFLSLLASLYDPSHLASVKQSLHFSLIVWDWLLVPWSMIALLAIAMLALGFNQQRFSYRQALAPQATEHSQLAAFIHTYIRLISFGAINISLISFSLWFGMRVCQHLHIEVKPGLTITHIGCLLLVQWFVNTQWLHPLAHRLRQRRFALAAFIVLQALASIVLLVALAWLSLPLSQVLDNLPSAQALQHQLNSLLTLTPWSLLSMGYFCYFIPLAAYNIVLSCAQHQPRHILLATLSLPMLLLLASGIPSFAHVGLQFIKQLLAWPYLPGFSAIFSIGLLLNPTYGKLLLSTLVSQRSKNRPLPYFLAANMGYFFWILWVLLLFLGSFAAHALFTLGYLVALFSLSILYHSLKPTITTT